jgi:glycosyltransferase involved in cell wall biosynthesis
MTLLYMKWFYAQMALVFSRSRQYRFKLMDLGIAETQAITLPPAIDLERFNSSHRDPAGWERLKVRQPWRLLYVGRVSIEKNLPLLVDAFRKLCLTRNDVALVIAGDGPYLDEMRRQLSTVPAYFLGYQNDQQLAWLYASADLLVFPSRTDTLGQVVMEAQACGLPVLVSNEGGPKELMDPGITGMIIPSSDPKAWCQTMDDLLSDEPRRMRMGRNAIARMARFSLAKTFETFWAEHVRISQTSTADATDFSQRPAAARHDTPSQPVAG